MVKFIQEQYPPGTRIRLNSMNDPYAPITPGTEGIVDVVDDAGSIHMKWDNGRTLAIVPGEDSFTVLPPKLETLKLYSRAYAGEVLHDSTSYEAKGRKRYPTIICAIIEMLTGDCLNRNAGNGYAKCPQGRQISRLCQER